MDLYYGKANALLRRAALSTLLGGAFGVLLLGALIFFAVQKAGPGRPGWGFWLAVAALAVGLIAWCWSTYRQLARVRVTEAGFELVEGNSSTLVPWQTLEEIQFKSRELRIRAAGRTFSINFMVLSDPQPLMDIISARKPAGVRLVVGNL